MASIINTNITSLIAQNNLSKTGDALQITIQRLSSGIRVNSAADDASGYAIANRMDSQIRGMAVASRNANDAISFAQTTTGGLSQISNDLQRMRELAVQAANGSNSSSDTSLLNQEFSQLQTEVARIQGSTTFNGVSVFNSTDTVFQIGANSSSNDRVNMQGNALTSTMSLGNLTITDRNSNTGLLDITNALTSASSYANTSITSGLSTQISYVANAMTDAVTSGQKLSFAAENELVNNIASAASSALATGMSLTDFATALQANFSVTTAQTYGPIVAITASTGTGLTPLLTTAYTNSQAASATLNSVYNAIKTAVDGAGGNFATLDPQLLTAYNQALAGGMTAAQFGAAFGSTGATITSGSATTRFGFQAATSSTTNNGLTALQTAASGQSLAQAAISSIDSALTEINNASATMGALQNRFTAVINNLSAFSQSQTAAKSRIVDTDFAAETARLSKSQILNQAGTAMLAQANQLPSSVLSLLR